MPQLFCFRWGEAGNFMWQHDTEDVLFGVPKVVLVGGERALIENHKGVVEYGSERVRVRTDYGLLEIGGANLTLGHLGRSDLVVQGKITRLEYR